MALIICEECGKQISSKASHCIHCGCPVTQKEEIDTSLYDFISIPYCENEKVDLFLLELTLKSWYGTSKETTRDIVKNKPHEILVNGIYGYNVNYVKEQLTRLDCKFEIKPSKSNEPNTANTKIEEYRRKDEEAKKPPVCPKCGSPHIVTGQRGHSILTGFWGSNKTVNRCSKCGYSWEPKKIT